MSDSINTCNVLRDEFEAWWIEHGYQLTQDKSNPVDFAEVVWLAAKRQNEFKEDIS